MTCVNAYGLKMPAHYVDMNAEEMEYDGGWGWFKSIVKVAILVTICVCVPVAIAAVATSIALTATTVAVSSASAYVAGLSTSGVITSALCNSVAREAVFGS